jgi:hypothetical protein
VFGKQPVKTGDPDVIKAIDGVAHQFRRHAGFFGDRQVCRACRGQETSSW